MLCALRAHAASGCLEATKFSTGFLHAATQSVATYASKPVSTKSQKSASGAAAVSKDPMYCWLQPVMCSKKNDAGGWALYQMVPATTADKAAAINVSAPTRYSSSYSCLLLQHAWCVVQPVTTSLCSTATLGHSKLLSSSN